MRQYLDLVDRILKKGKLKHPPQGVAAISIPAQQMRFDMDEGFPLLTSRNLKGSWKALRAELLWMLSGSTNAYDLHQWEVHLWDSWATPEICAKFDRRPGELGPLYGHQWRNFGATPKLISKNGFALEYWQDGADQISQMMYLLRTNPDSRRIRVSTWNPKEVWIEDEEDLVENVFITPCHGSFQIFHAEGELTLHLTQYSGDVPVGIPFNTAEYALLLMMIAKVLGLKAKELVHTITDAHMYVDQIPFMEELVTREPKKLPRVEIKPEATDIFGFQLEDFELLDYDPHPAIKGIPVSI